MHLESFASAAAFALSIALAVGSGAILGLREDSPGREAHRRVEQAASLWTASGSDACAAANTGTEVAVGEPPMLSAVLNLTLRTLNGVYNDGVHPAVEWQSLAFVANVSADALLRGSAGSGGDYTRLTLRSPDSDAAVFHSISITPAARLPGGTLLQRVQAVQQIRVAGSEPPRVSFMTPSFGYGGGGGGAEVWVGCSGDPSVLFGNHLIPSLVPSVSSGSGGGGAGGVNNLDAALLPAGLRAAWGALGAPHAPIPRHAALRHARGVREESDRYGRYAVGLGVAGFAAAAALLLLAFGALHRTAPAAPQHAAPPREGAGGAAPRQKKGVAAPPAPAAAVPPSPGQQPHHHHHPAVESSGRDTPGIGSGEFDAANLQTCLTASPPHSAAGDPDRVLSDGALDEPCAAGGRTPPSRSPLYSEASGGGGASRRRLLPSRGEEEVLPHGDSPAGGEPPALSSRGPVIGAGDFAELREVLAGAGAQQGGGGGGGGGGAGGYTFLKRYEFKNGSHIEVCSRDRAGSGGLKEYFIHGELCVAPQKFFVVCSDLAGRVKWDKYCKSIKVLEEYDGIRDCAIYWRVGGIPLVTDRDYVYYREIRVTPGEILSVSKAAPHPDMAKTRCVRVDSYTNHTSVTPSPRGPDWCCYTSLYFDDPKMAIPSSILNWITGTAVPKFLNSMFDVCSQPVEVDPELTKLAEAYSP